MTIKKAEFKYLTKISFFFVFKKIHYSLYEDLFLVVYYV